MLTISFRTFVFCLPFLVVNLSLAADLEEQDKGLLAAEPSVCVGYDHAAKKWGYIWAELLGSKEQGVWRHCAEHSAIFGVTDPGGTYGPGKYIRIAANCCPLPAPDILTDSHVTAEDSCPNDYVVTGNENRGRCTEGPCLFKMRCTKINTKRYQLGKKKAGAFWGFGSNTTFFKESTIIKRADIPTAIRYSMSRQNLTYFLSSGCVGIPFGSLLVEKKNKFCRGFFFRELQYRGHPGDPARGTPVRMFPDCDDISDIFDPDPDCIR